MHVIIYVQELFNLITIYANHLYNQKSLNQEIYSQYIIYSYNNELKLVYILALRFSTFILLYRSMASRVQPFAIRCTLLPFAGIPSETI